MPALFSAESVEENAVRRRPVVPRFASDALGAFLNANGRSFSAAFNLAHSYLVRPYLLLYRPCDEVRRIIYGYADQFH